MRFVRRASLIFSLVLIVAIVVGYVARSSELARDRDANLSASADLGSARLAALVQSADVAAAAGGDTAAAARAVAAVQPGSSACAIDADGHDCAGNGPAPDVAALDEEMAQRADGAVVDVGTEVSVYDSLMTIEAVGADQTVLVRAPADVIDIDTDAVVRVTTLLPPGTSVSGFVDDQGWRQTSTIVPRANGVYVVATVANDVHLPANEYRFYLIIFVLALLLMALAGVTLVVEHRSLVERASFDSLTRLPNRGEFERRAADVIASGKDEGACLLLFDLNGFKQVNDTYGHLAGDEMLKVVGSRLRKAVRDGDVVARWGGDEFVVMMPGVTTEEMGSRRALQLAEQIAGRTRLEGVAEALRVKVSVGVSIWPDHGGDLDELVVAADQAMYEAKREGTVCRIAAPRPEEPTLLAVHA